MKKTCFLISFLVLSICFFSCAIKQPNSKLFKKASEMFQQYNKAKYVENQKYIDNAHKFYNLVGASH